MKASRLLSVFLATTVIFASAMPASAKSPKAVLVNDTLDRAQAFKTVTGRKPGKSSSGKVALTTFSVEYVTAIDATNVRKEFMGDRRSTANMKFWLANAGKDELQAITERFHEQYKKALTDRGYEVLSSEQLQASEKFKEIMGEGVDAKEKKALLSDNESYVTYAQGTVPANFVGFSGAKFMKVSKQLDATLLAVKLRVSFASIKEMGWLDRAAANAAAGLSADMKMVVQGWDPNLPGKNLSELFLIAPTGIWPYELRQSLSLPGNVVDKIADWASDGATMNSANGDTSRTSRNGVYLVNGYQDIMLKDLSVVADILAEILPKK